MSSFATAVESRIRNTSIGVLEYFILGARATRFVFSRPFYWRDLLVQMDRIGVGSIPIVILTGFFTGMVLALQSSVELTRFGADVYIGNLVAASMVRELGPVLCALMVAGRAASGIAAELGSMKVTEQIDALVAMGRDPVAFLVVPRVVAGLLVFPPLVILANAMGLAAGWVIGLLAVDGLTSADIIYGMRYYFRPWALYFSVLKGGVFGLTITFIACFVGLGGSGGAEGVGRTTTTAVVATTLAIMVIDVLMVPILKAF